jgi:hypothetical protein
MQIHNIKSQNPCQAFFSLLRLEPDSALYTSRTANFHILHRGNLFYLESNTPGLSLNIGLDPKGEDTEALGFKTNQGFYSYPNPAFEDRLFLSERDRGKK